MAEIYHLPSQNRIGVSAVNALGVEDDVLDENGNPVNLIHELSGMTIEQRKTHVERVYRSVSLCEAMGQGEHGRDK